MDCWVVKTGAACFDVLQAYGVGILVATASALPVELRDEGLSYRLSSSLEYLPPATIDVLDTVWRLPTLKSLQMQPSGRVDDQFARANLDGLLAALFTQTGIRISSVADLAWKRRTRASADMESLEKVQKAITRWKQWAVLRGQEPSSWLQALLLDYREPLSAQPTLTYARKEKDLSIWMTLEPSLGFSTRQPLSDGQIARKTNLTMRSPHLAVVCALIGAVRFLRAQSVEGHRINYYVPLATTLTLQAETTLPPLPSVSYSVQQALLLQWLSYMQLSSPLAACWQGLAYQTLESQGAKQAISVGSGVLECEWARRLTRQTNDEVVKTWRSLLHQRPEDAWYDLDMLLSCLLTRQAPAWMAHVLDLARVVWVGDPGTAYTYSLKTCQEVTMAMMASTPSPLGAILERKEGTLCFGRSLRLLGQVNHAQLVDTLEALETVQTPEQLLDVLQPAAQACDVAWARTPFMVVPTEKDLEYLFDDVAQFGVRMIASLLRILSALHYPPVARPGQGRGSGHPASGAADGHDSDQAREAILSEGGQDYVI